MSDVETDLCEQAQQLDRQGEIIACEEICRQLLDDGRKRRVAYDLLSRSLARQGRIPQAIDACEKLLEEIGERPEILARLICYRNHDPNVSDNDLDRSARRFEATHRSAQFKPHHATEDPGKRLNVGFIGTEFYDHSKFFTTHRLLKCLDRRVAKIFAYSYTTAPDSYTKAVQGAVDEWRDISGVSDHEVDRQIRDDKIDILVDVMGFVGQTRLQCLLSHPAPIMVEYLEAPSGLSIFDYRFTDSVADPETADNWGSQPIRIPQGFHAYAPPTEAPEVQLRTNEDADQVVFCCFATAHKLSPPLLEAWIHLLHRMPRAKLILKNGSFRDRTFARRFLSQFEQAGIARGRVQCITPNPRRIHLSTYNVADIALDTFPVAGVTTTCEALWMGKPVVTLCGDRHLGRRTASLLASAGLGHLIATNIDDYVSLAIETARNITELRRMQATLRDTLRESPLCDFKRLARSLERAFREMWISCVNKRPQPADHRRWVTQ